MNWEGGSHRGGADVSAAASEQECLVCDFGSFSRVSSIFCDLKAD